MENGYIKLFRKSMNSRVFQNADLWKVWCWCLMKASWRERWETVTTGKGETEVHLMPGQFIFGRKAAADELKMKPSSIRNRMEKLKKVGNLDIQADTHWSLITIINWGAYQADECQVGQAIGHPEDTQRTPKGHKQEGIEVKRSKKEKSKKEKSPEENFILPEWVPEDLWDSFMEVRKAQKAANTPRALKTIIGKLERFRSEGYDPVDIIENSVTNSWKGVFKPKNNPQLQNRKDELTWLR